MPTQIESKPLVFIFTDFDGTILDHFSYSFTVAKPCIERLSKMGIPIIPNTSKTFAEVAILQDKMGLQTPLIVENGAAVYIPKSFLSQKPDGAVSIEKYWCKPLVKERGYWHDIIEKLKPSFSGQFETFSSMSIKRIAELTGLTHADALNASLRQYGEPIMWHGNNQQKLKFMDMAKELGASPLLGGRFLHICGNCNKGIAMQWLIEEYKKQHPHSLISSVALGDGNNDVDMLEVADKAVLIASPVHALPKLERTSNVYTSSKEGPEGWKEIMDQLIPES